MRLFWAMLVMIALGPPGCAQNGTSAVDQDRLEHADGDLANWMSHGRTYSEDRYSPLDAVNQKTVGRLGLAWSYEMKAGNGAEATPLVVDGIMYVTSAWSIVYALDAATGNELWVYDPKVPHSRLAQSCCGPANRGVAVWKGKVFVGTFDGRLVALDARTGTVIWDKLTIDRSQPYTITGAPRVAHGMVYIGNGGAELGVRGYVTAYDAETGAQHWRFYTTPNPRGPDHAASDDQRAKMLATWNPDAGAWHEIGGGGTAWDALVFDQETDTLWIGVGNGAPWNLEVRSPTVPGRNNDNLFLSSIVAVDARTGRYKCHYQQNPASTWDYTATQPMILTDLEVGGVSRKVLLQAPKNGFFYVIDRSNCALISAAPIINQTWADTIDMRTGRPIVRASARYTGKPAAIVPGGFGAHTWHPMAMSRQTGLVYIPVQEIPEVMYEEAPFRFRPGRFNTGTTEPILADTPKEVAALRQSVAGYLLAWNPRTQRAVWKVKMPGAVNGGTLATAGGLVFQGLLDGHLRAYDVANGKVLWEVDNGAATFAGPVTYSVDGIQYVATLAGYGGPIYLAGGLVLARVGDKSNARVNVYRLDGKATLPSANRREEPFPLPPALAATRAQVQHGGQVYSQNCIFCHGIAVETGGTIADLRRSPVLQSAEAWRATLHGARLEDGMPNFSDWIDDADAEAIRAYVVAKAKLAHDAQSSAHR